MISRVLALILSYATAALADDRDAFLAWADELPDGPVADDSAGYHTTADTFREAADTLREHPDVTVEHLGVTRIGTPLWAFHVPPTGTPDRKVLILAGLHPMEWIGTEVALATFEDVVVHRRDDVLVTLIPLLNPDGRARVENDLRAGRRTFQRGNVTGVDLNRDFAVHRDCVDLWGGMLPRYHLCSPASMSQPETRALDALADRERYDRAASLHAYGGFFYFPWSGRWKRPEDWATFVHLGRAMEGAQGPRAYKTRQLARWGFFFRAHGTEIDHLYGRYGTLAFLVELTRTGIRPFHPSDWKTPFRWYNPVDDTRHVDKGLAAMRALIDTPAPPGSRPLEDRREEGIGVVAVGQGEEVPVTHEAAVEPGQDAVDPDTP